jgi:hypothetical protein
MGGDMRFCSTIALLLPVMYFGGCAATTHVQEPDDPTRLFAAAFKRSGGIAGTSCNFVIHSDGTYSVHRSLGRHEEGESGTISGRKTWADLLANLKSARDDYPAPGGSADGYQYSASWKDRSVKWNALNQNLPPALRTLTDMLNKVFDETSGPGAS